MTYRLGVDLGTTWSAAAIARTGAEGTTSERSIEMARLGVRTAEIPSVVALVDEDTILVGTAAERRAATDPANVAREFKRRLGDPVPLIVAGKPRSAEALMGAMLQQIVAVVTASEGEPPEEVILTHPANWGPYKLERFSQVFQLGGLPTGQIVAEPVAAARHYLGEHDVEAGDTIVVFDFGGGTFDVAILQRSGAEFELVGKARGLEQLGGIDFDEGILRHVLSTTGIDFDRIEDNPSNRSAIDRLRHDCVAAKETLSDDTVAVIPVMLPDHHTEVRLNRAELEAMIRPAVTDAVTLLETTIAEAGLQSSDIDAVLLVGGTSRIPLVSQILTSRLNRPVLSDIHPKHAVALGAAAPAPSAPEALAGQPTTDEPGVVEAVAEEAQVEEVRAEEVRAEEVRVDEAKIAEPVRPEVSPNRAIAEPPSPPLIDPVTPMSAPTIAASAPRPAEPVTTQEVTATSGVAVRPKGRLAFAAVLLAVVIGGAAIALTRGGEESTDQDVASPASTDVEESTEAEESIGDPETSSTTAAAEATDEAASNNDRC